MIQTTLIIYGNIVLHTNRVHFMQFLLDDTTIKSFTRETCRRQINQSLAAFYLIFPLKIWIIISKIAIIIKRHYHLDHKNQ